MNLGDFEHLRDYDNVLITDEKGTIIFYDFADLKVLKEIGFRPEEFMGKQITFFYKNLTNENSTIMQVLKTGDSVCNIQQELITKDGTPFLTINSTYPIMENERIIGAIEFSKHFYRKENIQSLNQFAGHKVYRKNNTIYTIENLITIHPKMKAIKEKIYKVAKTDSTVLIYGKTGTGKEVVAQSIHNLSNRYACPFVSINCGAVPPNLLESTLFGTVKGSFTGSVDMPGLFEMAEGGTLFLDEINSLDVYLQVKLLKAIEEKAIRRIGGSKNIHLNIRVIAATNEDPENLLLEKRLREDLYYRLGVVQIDLPDLIERKEDINVLLEDFIDFYNKNMNVQIEQISPEVIESFNLYPWPGNIRELKNAIETGYNNATSNRITLDDIPKRIRNYSEQRMAHPKEQDALSLKDAVEQYEKSLIIQELKNTNSKLTEASKRLGISKQLLKYKIEKYRLY
ncbi:sigma 54-interacting transcriptional regulator [Bacillus sp. FJAT-49736]|uniref:sigma-54 interaction domain-containing protein n=1 Tax=Bacillus sp. FJAT-49736 TaxID=2833582 RepID=UPI001BC8F3D3|nr:sigma 54-interacting transcriptional regulator [Bacillus sp. FJAT-49736]MBS4172847.1 sigma 54-interacting transcriptional regulator [Bacillus sp. FJAT-49736]